LQESDSDDDDDGDVPSTPTPTARRGRPPGSLNKPKSKPDESTQKRKRFLQLYRTLLDFSDDGRQPILMFMEKPSKKLYPDYYQVIEHPIDMLSIEANIKADKYTNEDQLVSDFKVCTLNYCFFLHLILMFFGLS
jgi:protein polybromo-1